MSIITILQTRLSQGHRTTKFPQEAPTLPERYRGLPAIDANKCAANCRQCADACPTQAISFVPAAAPADGSHPRPQIDLGACLFCTACVEACPPGAITYTRDYRMAAARRQDLLFTGEQLKLAQGMSDELHKLLGRALRLREVCAGSCNACDMDTNVLNTVGWDLSRFGIQFVASPRHADGLVVTGPISHNMAYALKDTYDALPQPRIVIAIGACAISGGPYAGASQVHNGVEGMLPVDLYIPGCPPHPLTILDGLLRLIRRIK